ncbi:hypothetical protein Arnit_3077 [Arcobacter nitrofigilis DSM 7299]|uniref:Uncharacterized protein n=1 Tax=Arcobacter nitrofigilis (strain ATCC 33309 / DSM 7299 / CCUG 15893 / LMG 7604 / NCTC 12251 / CI) TaxID=572480 RepID=D5V7V4_ARCNC|nr:hypothetical protein [Arcobacter nitrofigilis]ADG94724.1 hypothetical protein Arnit_3077 [Arcobacter nitrofigilis DSM 7299]
MRIERKVDFLDQFTDMVIHIIFYFKVVLENPFALFVFCLILLTGLYFGVKQMILHRNKNPWTVEQKKDLKITIFLGTIIAGIFYFIIKE